VKKKIITHNGIFHADEIFAIGLLLCTVLEKEDDYVIERTRNIAATDYTDDNVWIIDVGGVYDPAKKLFDHHHDATLPASCILVLDHLLNTGEISAELHTELYKSFKTVSDIDTGGFEQFNGFQVNSLIKSFNCIGEEGFNISLDVCMCYIDSCIDSVKQSEESLDIWNTAVKLGEHIRICRRFPIHWKRYSDARYIVYPLDGKWNVLTINSQLYPLVAIGKEVFIHASKFLAVYEKYEDAVDSLTHTLAEK
jgi:uncharacterized UPF0160 family protein